MSKFNVGDVVTVRNDLEIGEWYGENDVVREMLKFRGKQVEIEAVLENNQYLIKGDTWSWTDEMFEEGKEEDKMPKFKVGDVVRIKDEFDYDLVNGEVGYVDGFEAYHGKIATITYITCGGNYNIDIDDENYNWHESQFDFAEPVPKSDDSIIMFAKLRDGAIIPSKREEDGCYDLYICTDEDVVIQPHQIKLIPTGICSTFSKKYRIGIRERGSNTKSGLITVAGQIDSNYTGEWFLALYNSHNVPARISRDYTEYKVTPLYAEIPYNKAQAQFAVEYVPQVEIKEVDAEYIKNLVTNRGAGCLGSSNK